MPDASRPTKNEEITKLRTLADPKDLRGKVLGRFGEPIRTRTSRLPKNGLKTLLNIDPIFAIDGRL